MTPDVNGRIVPPAIIIWAVLLLIALLPYFAGAAYAALAVPFYNVGCGNSQVSLLSSVLSIPEQEHYILFLDGKGCTPDEAYPPNKRSANIFDALGKINDTYQGRHQHFSDDVIGRLFDPIAHYVVTVAVESRNGTAVQVLSCLRISAWFRVFYYVCYSALIVAAIQFINLGVKHLFDVLKRWPRLHR